MNIVLAASYITLLGSTKRMTSRMSPKTAIFFLNYNYKGTGISTKRYCRELVTTALSQEVPSRYQEPASGTGIQALCAFSPSSSSSVLIYPSHTTNLARSFCTPHTFTISLKTHHEQLYGGGVPCCPYVSVFFIIDLHSMVHDRDSQLLVLLLRQYFLFGKGKHHQIKHHL